MKLKQELLDLLISYGMTKEDIEELVSRLSSNALDFDKVAEKIRSDLEFNEVVKKGLEETLIDAETKAGQARQLLLKVVDLG